MGVQFCIQSTVRQQKSTTCYALVTGAVTRRLHCIGKKFELGQLLITPGALESIPNAELNVAINCHAKGDWGKVCDDDAGQNAWALENDARLMSVYEAGDTLFWIITEADRSTTTILLPEEY